MVGNERGGTLHGKQGAGAEHHRLHAETLRAFEHEGAQKVPRAVEEQCREGGKELVGIAQATGGGEQRQGERHEGAHDEEAALAAHGFVDAPIGKFRYEEHAQEPFGRGETLPEEMAPRLGDTGHEELAQDNLRHGEDDGGDEELAHALVEERHELLMAGGIEAHAADEEEQGHVEGVDENATGNGRAADAVAYDHEDNANALGNVESNITHNLLFF